MTFNGLEMHMSAVEIIAKLHEMFGGFSVRLPTGRERVQMCITTDK